MASSTNINSYINIRYSPEVATYDNTTAFRPDSTSSCLPINTGTDEEDFNIDGIHPYEPLEGILSGVDDFNPQLVIRFDFDIVSNDYIIPYNVVQLEGVVFSEVFGGGSTPGFDFFRLTWVLNIVNPGTSNNIINKPPTDIDLYLSALSGGETATAGVLNLSSSVINYSSVSTSVRRYEIRLYKAQTASTFVTYNFRYTLI